MLSLIRRGCFYDIVMVKYTLVCEKHRLKVNLSVLERNLFNYIETAINL